jgi:hypothetical protein
MALAEANYRTVADVAIEEASIAASLTDRFLFTGRMLVKATYENAELPTSVDASDAIQFYVPELRIWAGPFVRFAAANFRQPRSVPKMMLHKMLATNKQAKHEPDSFVIYTSEGRLDPGSK